MVPQPFWVSFNPSSEQFPGVRLWLILLSASSSQRSNVQEQCGDGSPRKPDTQIFYCRTEAEVCRPGLRRSWGQAGSDKQIFLLHRHFPVWLWAQILYSGNNSPLFWLDSFIICFLSYFRWGILWTGSTVDTVLTEKFFPNFKIDSWFDRPRVEARILMIVWNTIILSANTLALWKGI